MEYLKDRLRDIESIDVGGFKFHSPREINSQLSELHKSLSEYDDEWVGVDLVNNGDLFYISERSAYKAGYINPLFGEDLFFLSLEEISLHNSNEGVFVSVDNEYTVVNVRDETNTLEMRLMDSSGSTVIESVCENIQFLLPSDKLVSKIFNASGEYLSSTI